MCDNVKAFTVIALLGLHFGTAKLDAGEWGSWRGLSSNGISRKLMFRRGGRTLKMSLGEPSYPVPVVQRRWFGVARFFSQASMIPIYCFCVSVSMGRSRRRKIGQGNQNARGDEGIQPLPSPITDGDHVWALMGTGDFACFTVDGEPVWSFNLQERYGKFKIQFGMSSHLCFITEGCLRR